MNNTEIANRIKAINDYAIIGDYATAHMVEDNLYTDLAKFITESDDLEECKDLAIAVLKSKELKFKRRFI